MDVVIIGGGVIGSSIAYFLAAQKEFDGKVLVIEKDPTYARSSTSLSVGGIRQQFSISENIQMSKFGAEFFRAVPEVLAVGDDLPNISFNEAGYLFLATEKGLADLKQNYELQKRHQVEVLFLEADALKNRFPWLHTDDLAGGTLGLKGEGWIDPYSLLMAFKKKALALGVIYQKEEVVGLERKGNHVESVGLKNSGKVACRWVVNAAGISAAAVAGMAGIPDLPVHPRKRCVFTFACRQPIPGCPLVIDPSGVYFRSEGNKFLCGVSPPAEQDSDCHDFKVDTNLFYEVIWPTLAHRVPAFEALERQHSWAGHYAYNVFDQNAILGPHPVVTNFYFANGFSGHGLQQSPAVGRAISEMITFGAYKTLDLSKFAFDRFAAGELIKERKVI
ncbi:MAG: NAD(P)/FAD-dependent oxidoreductase [bacterium]